MGYDDGECQNEGVASHPDNCRERLLTQSKGNFMEPEGKTKRPGFFQIDYRLALFSESKGLGELRFNLGRSCRRGRLRRVR